MSYTPATEALITALQALPGVGVRTAQRMALQLLERDTESAQRLSLSLINALDLVKKCPECRTLTESDVCEVCADGSRDHKTICVVANDADKSGIEMSSQFRGRYFVLHGVLSPIDGVGPEELGIFDLVDFVKGNSVEEIIIALDEQIESEATVHYLKEQLKTLNVTLSRIHFHQMKSGSLDKAETSTMAHAWATKESIGFEHD